MSHLWACDRMKTVTADTAAEAAEVFAGRIARRYYGMQAYATDLRPDRINPLLWRARAVRKTRWAGEAGCEIRIDLEKRA